MRLYDSSTKVEAHLIQPLEIYKPQLHEQRL